MSRAAEKIFISVEAVIFAAFSAMDLMRTGGSAPLKFAGMALCLACSVYISVRGGEKLVTAAIALSLAADTLLLLADAHYAVGVALFFLAQSMYFARIRRENGERSAALARVCLFLAAIALLASLDLLTALNALVAAYITFFVCNVAQSFKVKNRLFSLGLCLFLCCDICVGLFNAPFALPPMAKRLAGLGMWTFYLPSQVMITLSGRKRDE